MKKIDIFVFLIIFAFEKGINCYRYTLPGDQNWPNISFYSNLKSKLNGNMYLKGENGYKPFTWNRITNSPKPAVIVQPKNTDDVIEAMKFAKNYGMMISVASTGHHQDVRNLYDNSVHLDMSQLNFISINLVQKTLTLGPGNRFSRIHPYVATQSNNKLVALGGADPGVGIYGWTVGGGHGFFTRHYGLGVDALISIDLVLANLTVITASETQNSDLFRAIRGSGGGAYGITVNLTVKLYDAPGSISTFSGIYPLNTDTSSMFANWMKNAPNQASAYFMPNNYVTTPNIGIFATCYVKSNETYSCYNVLSPLIQGCIKYLGISKCVPEVDKFSNYISYFQSLSSDTSGVVSFASTALNANNIVQGLNEITTFIKNNRFTGCSGNAVIGGASSQMDLNQNKTSVSPDMRNGLIAITCFSAMDDDANVDTRKYQVNVMVNLAENILKKYSNWVYWNEPQHYYPNNDWQGRFVLSYSSVLVSYIK